jgi:4-alpha-glucanotransferase
MNVPGRAEGQWRWRCTEAALADTGWERLHALTREAGRSADPVPATTQQTQTAR